MTNVIVLEEAIANQGSINNNYCEIVLQSASKKAELF